MQIKKEQHGNVEANGNNSLGDSQSSEAVNQPNASSTGTEEDSSAENTPHPRKEESNSYVSYNGNSDDTPPVEPS